MGSQVACLLSAVLNMFNDRLMYRSKFQISRLKNLFRIFTLTFFPYSKAVQVVTFLNLLQELTKVKLT